MKRKILTLLVMSLFLLPYGVRAAWPVIDAANLSRNTITSLQTIQDVAHQVTQIQNQIRQYEAMLQTLQSLDSQAFNQVKSLLQSQTDEYNQLFNDLNSIGYSLGQIDSEFNQLFPQGTDWNTIDFSQFEGYFQNWNQELSESAKTAMEAQTLVSKTQQYNDEVNDILSRSMGADGEVRQLQAQNQMMGILSQQLGDLTGNLAASGRLTATLAAQAAAKEDASAEFKRRMVNGYGGERTDHRPSQSLQ